MLSYAIIKVLKVMKNVNVKTVMPVFLLFSISSKI